MDIAVAMVELAMAMVMAEAVMAVAVAVTEVKVGPSEGVRVEIPRELNVEERAVADAERENTRRHLQVS